MHFISGYVRRQELVQFYLSPELSDSPLCFVPFAQNYLRQMFPFISNSSLHQQYPVTDSKLTSHWTYLVGSKLIFMPLYLTCNSGSSEAGIIFYYSLSYFSECLGLLSTMVVGTMPILVNFSMIRRQEERILIYLDDKWSLELTKVEKKLNKCLGLWNYLYRTKYVTSFFCGERWIVS